MIVPEIAGAAAGELDELRAACDAAVARLVAARPDVVAVVGSAWRPGRSSWPYRGTFAAWGSPAGFSLGGDAGTPVTDLSLLVGGWLLARHDLDGLTVTMDGIGAVPAAEAGAVGAEIVDRRPRVALLVMGDGSACRGEKAPGYADPRAGAYDERVAAALADADPDALLALDPVLSDELQVAGRAPWQALAGAARATGGAWQGDLRHHAAPYGVAYFVATWEPAR